MAKTKKPVEVKLSIEALDFTGYHVFLNVTVNGKRCRFLLDTGASHSVVDKAFFEKHFGKRSLKTVKQSTTGLHSSTVESHFGRIKDLKIGALLIKKFTAAAIDLNHVNATYASIKKAKIHGILGSDILRANKMIIDYGQGKLIIPA